MLQFINAKLNLGLNIVNRRSDGYHDLQTLFYPVGRYNGTSENPEQFCDILEITSFVKTEFIFGGRKVDCPVEKNLVYKAWKLFKDNYSELPEYKIRLEKHIPDGAGLGGGSADATFVLRMLNELNDSPFTDDKLEEMALKLGADCPVFVKNKPCYAEGVGEKMKPIDFDLSGWWCALVKPDLSISTKEAFAGVTPAYPAINLRDIVKMPVEEWNGLMKNDFEESLFPNHPVLAEIKAKLLANGASYAAMSGSGSTIFGLFHSRKDALASIAHFPHHFTSICLL